ncbi:MAG: hypothetical protein NC335_05900 [Bacteroides sp.]|nr:hypothetical protein [Bacteroides sp.]
MKKIFRMFGAAAMAAAVFGTASCEKNPQDETKEYTLELANPADAEIFVNEGHTTATTVELVLGNITRDQLVVTATENEGNWCSATVSEDADAIIVTPGANNTAEDKTAAFKVSANVEGVTPVVIKVTSTGSETEIFVEIECAQASVDQYGGFTFNPSTAGEALNVTVKTNAEKWYLNDMNMVTDDEFNPVEWYTVDRTSGRNGETCIVTFSANTGTEDRKVSLMFTDEPDGYMGASVMVTQSGKPATEVAVTYYDENYNETTVEGKTLDVNFGKDVAGWESFDFDMEKDGSVDFLFVKPGTMEADQSIVGADMPWVGLSATYGYSIVPTANTTGADRSADLVILPAGDKTKELFRFKITQAGK